MAFLKANMVSIAALLLWAPASAQQRDLGPPTGKVSIRQLQVAFIGSGASGGGTLTYRGKSYGITVGGLGIGGIGTSRLQATGTVYGLTRREDFAGAYVQLREGWAIGDQGRGVGFGFATPTASPSSLRRGVRDCKCRLALMAC